MVVFGQFLTYAENLRCRMSKNYTVLSGANVKYNFYKQHIQSVTAELYFKQY